MAILLIALASGKFGPRRVENATFLGVDTDPAENRLATFVISNPGSNTLLRTMYFVAADASTKLKGIGKIRGHWLRDEEIRVKDGIRIGVREAPEDGKWILEGLLLNTKAHRFAKQPALWIVGIVEVLTSPGERREEIQLWILKLFGLVYKVRSAPFRPDQPVSQEAAAGAAP